MNNHKENGSRVLERVAQQTEMTKKLILSLRQKRWPRAHQFKYLPRVLDKKEKRLIKILGVIISLSAILWGANFYFRILTLQPKVGGEYTEGLVGSIRFINPLFASKNDVDMDISRLVFSGLMKYDKELNLKEDLAEKYAISEDQKTYTFTLRENLKWHDGEPISANDVIFTFDSIMEPEFKSPLYKSFQGVAVEKIDERTIAFSLQEPFAPFLTTLTLGILPQHVWEEIPASSASLSEYNQKPIGSGPYKFDSLVREKKIGTIKEYRLVRNEEFYLQKSYIDALRFKIYESFEEASAALKNKDIQGVNFLPKPLLETNSKSSFEFRSLTFSQYTAIFFNQKHNEYLSDNKVRTALAHALDKPRIIQETLSGEAETIHGPILSGFLGYNSELQTFEYDMKKSDELLASAGWKKISKEKYYEERKQEELKKLKAAAPEASPESSSEQNSEQTPNEASSEILETSYQSQVEEILKPEFSSNQEFFRLKENGEILKVQLTTVDQPTNTKVAELVQKFWQDIGVKTELRVVTGAQIKKEALKNRDYDALLYAEAIGSDPDPYPFWHSSQNKYPGLNLAIFSNEEVDKLLEEARKTTDSNQRELKYRHFQNILVAELPAIFLYHSLYTYPQTSDIKGFDVKRISTPADRFNNITEWYIKTERVYGGM